MFRLDALCGAAWRSCQMNKQKTQTNKNKTAFAGLFSAADDGARLGNPAEETAIVATWNHTLQRGSWLVPEARFFYGADLQFWHRDLGPQYNGLGAARPLLYWYTSVHFFCCSELSSVTYFPGFAFPRPLGSTSGARRPLGPTPARRQGQAGHRAFTCIASNPRRQGSPARPGGGLGHHAARAGRLVGRIKCELVLVRIWQIHELFLVRICLKTRLSLRVVGFQNQANSFEFDMNIL